MCIHSIFVHYLFNPLYMSNPLYIYYIQSKYIYSVKYLQMLRFKLLKQELIFIGRTDTKLTQVLWPCWCKRGQLVEKT